MAPGMTEAMNHSTTECGNHAKARMAPPMTNPMMYDTRSPLGLVLFGGRTKQLHRLGLLALRPLGATERDVGTSHVRVVDAFAGQ